MGLLDEELKIIRGYVVVTVAGKEIKDYFYDGTYNYDDVIDAIHKCLYLLSVSKYHTNVATIDSIKSHTFGPYIREAIAKSVEDIIIASGVVYDPTPIKIREVHYGRDIRDILYDFLIRYGAEEDLYYQTTKSDYIYTTSESGVTLIKYIGGMQYIATPIMIDGIPVTEIGIECFKDCGTPVKAVKILDGLKTIN